MNSWGKHFLVDCFNCNNGVLSESSIINFVNDLVVQIDMKAYGLPILKHFAEHDPEKAGWTLCQLIETSLIDGHFVDKTKDAYISVHSCKEFDIERVIATIKKHFSPKRITYHCVYRQA